MSWRLTLLNLWLRWHEKPYLARETHLAAARARMEAQAAQLPLPARVVAQAATLWTGRGRVPALRIGGGTGLVLWFHGGAYSLGSPRTHAAMVAALAVRAGAGAVLPSYRRAPEHGFPAAVEDAFAAWRGLMADGVPPGRVVLGGDSAGGGLAMALLHDLLAQGLAPPAGVVLFSPWVDLTLSGASIGALARRDVLIPAGRMAEARDLYLGGADPRDPRASPVFGRFGGAPPVLIQASRAEVLRDDALRLADRLRGEGVAGELDLRARVPHVWQAFHRTLPEADAALDRAGAFVRARVAGVTSGAPEG